MPLTSEGGSGAESQSEVLERFLEIVAPDSIEVITADREFISVPWMRRLQPEAFRLSFVFDRFVGLGECPRDRCSRHECARERQRENV